MKNNGLLFKIKRRIRYNFSILNKNLRIYRESSKSSKRVFSDVKRFLLFIGYSRSGSTITGSIIDAHPNACISYEINFYIRKKKYFL